MSIEIILSNKAYLKSFAMKLTRNVEESEDLIQETMLRAFSNIGKFQEGTNLKAWLFTIMKNIFINNYRKRQKQSYTLDITENIYQINGSYNAVNAGENYFIMDDIQKAMKLLPSEYKTPFLLHYKGFKYQEISDKLNLPLGTVKSRIFFARKELKELLKAYENR